MRTHGVVADYVEAGRAWRAPPRPTCEVAASRRDARRRRRRGARGGAAARGRRGPTSHAASGSRPERPPWAPPRGHAAFRPELLERSRACSGACAIAFADKGATASSRSHRGRDPRGPARARALALHREFPQRGLPDARRRGRVRLGRDRRRAEARPPSDGLLAHTRKHPSDARRAERGAAPSGRAEPGELAAAARGGAAEPRGSVAALRGALEEARSAPCEIELQRRSARGDETPATGRAAESSTRSCGADRGRAALVLDGPGRSRHATVAEAERRHAQLEEPTLATRPRGSKSPRPSVRQLREETAARCVPSGRRARQSLAGGRARARSPARGVAELAAPGRASARRRLPRRASADGAAELLQTRARAVRLSRCASAAPAGARRGEDAARGAAPRAVARGAALRDRAQQRSSRPARPRAARSSRARGAEAERRHLDDLCQQELAMAAARGRAAGRGRARGCGLAALESEIAELRAQDRGDRPGEHDGDRRVQRARGAPHAS